MRTSPSPLAVRGKLPNNNQQDFSLNQQLQNNKQAFKIQSKIMNPSKTKSDQQTNSNQLNNYKLNQQYINNSSSNIINNKQQKSAQIQRQTTPIKSAVFKDQQYQENSIKENETGQDQQILQTRKSILQKRVSLNPQKINSDIDQLLNSNANQKQIFINIEQLQIQNRPQTTNIQSSNNIYKIYNLGSKQMINKCSSNPSKQLESSNFAQQNTKNSIVNCNINFQEQNNNKSNSNNDYVKKPPLPNQNNGDLNKQQQTPNLFRIGSVKCNYNSNRKILKSQQGGGHEYVSNKESRSRCSSIEKQVSQYENEKANNENRSNSQILQQQKQWKSRRIFTPAYSKNYQQSEQALGEKHSQLQTQGSDYMKQHFSAQDLDKIQKSRYSSSFGTAHTGEKVEPRPQVSSKSWAIYELDTMKLIDGKSAYVQREVASLTKIMTLYATVQILHQYKLDAQKMVFQVSKWGSRICGTSASLKQGMFITLNDLFYGLMLPSGNDAAFVIAENMGTFLSLSNDEKDLVYERENFRNRVTQTKGPVYKFLNEMNKYGEKLDLSATNYANPHGLMHKENKSSSSDVGKLSCFALSDPYIRKIVGTIYHSCFVELKGEKIKMEWENSNKLLQKENWFGMKTGITDAAGPCLASSVHYYDQYEKKEKSYVVVILSCKSMEARWEESEKLANWAHRKLCLKSKEGLMDQYIKNMSVNSKPNIGFINMSTINSELDKTNKTSKSEYSFSRDRELTKHNKSYQVSSNINSLANIQERDNLDEKEYEKSQNNEWDGEGDINTSLYSNISDDGKNYEENDSEDQQQDDQENYIKNKNDGEQEDESEEEEEEDDEEEDEEEMKRQQKTQQNHDSNIQNRQRNTIVYQEEQYSDKNICQNMKKNNYKYKQVYFQKC